MKIFSQILLLVACCTIVLTACDKAAKADANVSDADITTHVKSALNNESGLAGQDITVVTTKGDVRLTGVLASQAQIDTALGIARIAEGAHTIHNELTVKQ